MSLGQADLLPEPAAVAVADDERPAVALDDLAGDGETETGGLLSSTVLSLVYVPVVYTLVDDLERRLGRLLSKLLPKEPATA